MKVDIPGFVYRELSEQQKQSEKYLKAKEICQNVWTVDNRSKKKSGKRVPSS